MKIIWYCNEEEHPMVKARLDKVNSLFGFDSILGGEFKVKINSKSTTEFCTIDLGLKDYSELSTATLVTLMIEYEKALKEKFGFTHLSYKFVEE